METVNTTASVWTKTGSLVKAFDLSPFFGTPAGFYQTDPTVVFDSPTDRWFVSSLAFDANNDSYVFVAVSAGDDPLGSWDVFGIGPTSGVITDQPGMGVSLDKVVLSWNDFSGAYFSGNEVWVFEKADLLAGAVAPRYDYWAPDPTYYSVEPVKLNSTTAESYLGYTNSGAGSNTLYPSIGVVTITGTPAVGNLAWNEDNPAVPTTAMPPYGRQAYGSALDTADDRATSAVSQNGTMWIAGNDRCVPAGDARARSCIRITAVSVAGATVLEVFDLALRGSYLAYGALALTATGEMHIVASISSAKSYPSIITTGETAPAGSLLPAATLAEGEGPLDNWQKSVGANRWGDYSGAATDPTDPTVVWLAGEFAATGADLKNWGTAIGQQDSSLPSDTVRPAFFRVHDGPDPFSPNGDGKADMSKIYWNVSEGAVVADSIYSLSGRRVFDVTGYVTKGHWYDVWTGRSNGGWRLPAGKYRYVIAAIDSAGNTSKPAKGTITLVR